MKIRWILPFLIVLLSSNNAFAMHIADGIISLQWSLLWFALVIPFIFLGIGKIKKLSESELFFKPLIGLLTALVFIISVMPIPVPIVGTCSHPTGVAVSSIILGPFVSVIVSAVALLFQALFLAHGGLTTLGANIFSMGVVGSFTSYAIFRLCRKMGLGIILAGFLAGIMADWTTYAATSFQLASGLAKEGEMLSLLWKISLAFVPTQLPLGIIEGGITAGALLLLYKRRKDILLKMNVLQEEGK